MIFTECNENNEIVFNEGKSQFAPGLSSIGINNMKKTYINICNKIISYVKSHKKQNEIYYPGCGAGGWDLSASELADQSITGAHYVHKGIPLINRHKYTQKMIPICGLVHADEKIMDELFTIADKCISLEDRDFLFISRASTSLALKTYAIKYESANNASEILAFSGNTGGSYMHDALYESYIQAKIDAEDRLAFALKESMIISESDYSNIRVLQEAKLGDKIKAKWKKFIAFIKGMVARFMESMTNLVLNEKDYLEKYKKIICYKNPKNTIEYDSDYRVATNRLIGVEIPLFDYAKYKDVLEAKDKGELVKKIMSGKQGFSYDDGVELAELFKGYFLALDTNRTVIKAGDSSKIMEDMYNFCHGFEKMQATVDKDIRTLDNSTRRIEALIKERLDSKENKDDAVSKPDAKINNNERNSAESGSSGNDDTGAVVSNNSSAIIYKNGFIINEKVKITEEDPSSNPISKMNSTNEEDEDTEKNLASNASDATKNKTDKDIQDAANKWIEVCRIIIAAKLTACKQITEDYMKIIRTHVRSYGGTDKKDTSNNVSPTGGTKYTKAAAKAAIEAKKDS